MGALIQDWFNKTIWDTTRRSIYDLNGTYQREVVFGSNDNFSNEIVTERRAHGLATVYTCINVRAKTIASLPISIIQEREKKKQSLTDHPAYYILAQQPNNYMSSANMFMTSMIHSDSWGNSIIGINRDGRTRPTSFDIVMPDEWQVTVKDGDAFYKINGEMYSSRDVLHFRWFSLDGINGISPIRQNAMTMGKAIRNEKFFARSIGKNPDGGILSYEGDQKPEQRAENQKNWKQDIDAGRTPILSGRWSWIPYGLNPAEVQYIETEGLSDQRICGIFSVPPSFIQNYVRMTWSNSEQADLVYAKHTISPIVKVIEQECNMKLFTEKEKANTFVKMNMNGLLRGDIVARAQFYTAMRNVGGLNGNDIRELEDRNGYNGGEIFTTQSANIPIDQLRDFYANKVAPTAGSDPSKTKEHVNGRVNGQEILN